MAPSKRQMVRAAILAAMVIGGTGGAEAADQLILGQRLQLKNPLTDVSKRRVIGQARERLSPNTLVGDPTVNGATGQRP